MGKGEGLWVGKREMVKCGKRGKVKSEGTVMGGKRRWVKGDKR